MKARVHAALVCGTLLAIPAHAQELKTVHVQGNVHLVVGGAANSAVQVGPQSLVLVDTQAADASASLIAAVRQLSPRPIQLIINTHAHPDHTGGNAAIAKAGLTAMTRMDVGATITAHEDVQAHMSMAQPPVAVAAWPTDTFFDGEVEWFVNGEAIRVIHMPGHTSGDSIVYFRESDVVIAGDVFSTMSYPFIDAARGGSIDGVIQALNNIIDIAIPEENQEGGTLIVPGHGRVTDEYEVVLYRDMLTVIRARIQEMVKAGRTLEQVRAAKPTLDYDGRYGSSSGPWTTDMFVEAVFRAAAGKGDTR